MSELLFIAHCFPYPPDKGEKIRAWHFLRHLAQSRTVHLACLSDEPIDRARLAVVTAICAECHIEAVQRSPIQWRNLGALVSGQPITCSHFYRPGMARWITDLLARRPVDTILAYSGAMARYVPAGSNASCTRIIDFVDVDSEKWRHYAARSSWPKSQLYAREAKLLRDYEHRVARAFDACVFVSESETALFRSTGPACGSDLVPIENGVEADDCMTQRPPRPKGMDERTLLFVGTMDYWPNVDAVSWFAREVYPLIRNRHPGATFAIVGANPSREVQRLGALDGVRVVGAVDAVQPYLAHTAAAVIPLRISPGIPNKVLEAMAMAKPVITTTAAIRGLQNVSPSRHLLIGDDPAAFAAQVSRILSRPQEAEALGQEARRCVLAHYTWERSLEKLDRLLEGGAGSLRSGAA